MILNITGLSKHFDGLIALDKVDLQVNPRTIHSIIGPNGAGKTTFFNVLTGILPATDGRIEFDGQPITNCAPHVIAAKGIARTFQEMRLFKLMTILDNIRVGMHIQTTTSLLAAIFRTQTQKREEARILRRANELLEIYGLLDRKDEFAQNLPYGDQRRLEILRALAQEPKLLLLDEPTAGMNLQETEELTAFIKHLKDDLGLTVLMIEHDMRVVMSISDRITVLDCGKKIAEGTAEAIQNDPAVIEAYLGHGREEIWNAKARGRKG